MFINKYTFLLRFTTGTKYFLFALFLLLFIPLIGQDYKFAQYYNAPLNLNPALTGKIQSLYRLTANYRMQYFNVQSPSPYTTISGSADFGLFRDKLNKDIFGIGVVFGNDRQTILRTNKLDVSAAYHKSIGYNKQHYFSAGIQFGFMQRSIDLNNLYFGSQFIDDRFDLTKPTLENFNTNKVIKPDLNLGVFWSSSLNKDKIGVFAGVSAFNLFLPNQSFMYADYERSARFAVYAGSSFQIKQIMMIIPNALFAMQAKNIDWNVGTNLAFNIAEKKYAFKSAVLFGVFYDGNGLLSTNVGIQHQGFMAMLGYDASLVKDINKAVKSVGAMEVSIIYTGKPINTKVYQLLFCPKF